MTIPLREQHKNFGATLLDGSINNSVTSLDVTDGSVLPSTGNFRIMIGTEIMVVTARSSDTLTVVRGQDGTSAASHTDQDPVNHIYSTQGVNRLFNDNEGLWGYASRPPMGIYDNNGDLVTSSHFTWVNQDSATVTDRGGTILMNCPKRSAISIHAQEITAPSTPYTYIAAMRCAVCVASSDAKPTIGLGFRESGTGKLVVIGLLQETFFEDAEQFRVLRLSGPTTSVTAPKGPLEAIIGYDYLWLKVEADGTDITFYASADGVEWIELYSEAKNTYFTTAPDRVFWYGADTANNGTGSTELLLELAHWSKGE